MHGKSQKVNILRSVIPNPLETVLKNGLKPFKGMKKHHLVYLDWINNLLKSETWPSADYEHLKSLQLLLFIEQYYIEKEIETHNLSNYEIEREDEKYFRIKLQIDEDDPFVTKGDFVVVGNHYFQIVEVRSGVIRLWTRKPTKWFIENGKYNIKFKVNDFTRKCHLFAVRNMIKQHKNHIFLYPKLKPSSLEEDLISQEIVDINTWFDKSILENAEQKQAVQHIISKTSRPAPYILFGPPGTGKTATIVESILQIYFMNESDQVLVCTPSNTAADEITQRLLNNVPQKHILRTYSRAKNVELIDKKILPVVAISNIDIKKKLKIARLVISTLTYSSHLLDYNMSESFFSYVFIDEACQATEPESLVPFCLFGKHVNEYKCPQFVFAGDPKQLGPVVKCKYIERFLGLSMMERMMKLKLYQKNQDKEYNPNYITQLVKNFRSHDRILKIPNELFYDSFLEACGGREITIGEHWEHLPNKVFPVIFHAVEGSEETRKNCYSVCNFKEVRVVLEYLKKLRSGFAYRNVGVVTPYKLQEKCIKDALKRSEISDVNVGTIQTFQGQEKDVIIISTVRSKLFQYDGNTHIGFLSCRRRFNVALTRAKCLLIVIGNPNVLKYDSMWNTFMSYCLKNKACLGSKFVLKSSVKGNKNYK